MTFDQGHPNEDEATIENATADAAERATEKSIEKEKSLSATAGDPGDPNNPQVVATNSGGRRPRDGDSRRGSHMPVTEGRAIFEAVYHQHRQPQQWDNPADGSYDKGEKNPRKWAGVLRPLDWNDTDEDGHFTCSLRLECPHAFFLSSARISDYREALLKTQEPYYLALWATRIDQTRWTEAESLIFDDEGASRLYRDHFEISGPPDLNPTIESLRDRTEDWTEDIEEREGVEQTIAELENQNEVDSETVQKEADE